MKLITTKETMRRLSIGRTTVYRLIAEGRLTAVTVRGARRIQSDSVHQVVNKGAA